MRKIVSRLLQLSQEMRCAWIFLVHTVGESSFKKWHVCMYIYAFSKFKKQQIKMIFVDFSLLKGIETKGCETLPLLNFPIH